ncbi:hypothetical protein Q4490_00160 [Neptunomonas phycophila]|uniref:DUF4760 domain-containing protein n=1 Tax=Neptunomonas phycophila TaxID=1572645 RepID=A0AAW7XEG5_9GAMM|nr:hypothetical protein [Neptunomonas phycophila]MDO6451962.1 hypothetical protein [Neptunomonas phycophila]
MTIFISLLSSVIAAFLAHYLATARMKRAELSKFQIEAYSSFTAAAARLAVARRVGDTTNENIDIAALNDAKSRIITCGHAEVVEAMIQFWILGGTLERESEILAFDRLVKVMRTKLGHKAHDILELKVSDALFKLEPATFSFRAGELANKSSQQDASKTGASA